VKKVQAAMLTPVFVLIFLTMTEASSAKLEHRFIGCSAASIDNQKAKKTLLMTQAISQKVEQGKAILSVKETTPAQPAQCTEVTEPVDLVFLVDSSGSIKELGFRKSQEYLKDVVSELQVGKAPTDTRVAVVQFSSTETVEIKLDEGISKEEINNAVDKMEFHEGATCPGDGIHKVRKVFDDARKNAQKMLVILTDGDPSGPEYCPGNHNLEKEVTDARQLDGIHTLVVGVGSDIQDFFCM
jgi:hypothetical protein